MHGTFNSKVPNPKRTVRADDAWHLAVQYAAFCEAFRTLDRDNPDSVRNMRVWASMLQEQQQKMGLVLASDVDYWAEL